MSINREILKLSIPNILSNISVPLLSSVDTILMGHLSAAHLGAVGLGSMVFNFIYWNFGFLRMGTTGLTAQAYGREDRKEIVANLGRAAMVALFLALAILLLQIGIFKGSVLLLSVIPGQIDLVGDYYYTRMWAAPATLLLYVLMGWFFGMQNAIYPLILTIFINGINIIVSAYLVRVEDLGMTGVAAGTVIAQYLGCILALLLLWYKYRNIFLYFKARLLWVKEAFISFLDINRDLFIRTVMLTFSFGFFYRYSSASGAIVLAVNVVLLQFLNWMSYGIDGFAYAAESIVGKYKGKQDDKMMHDSIKYTFYWGGGFALAYALTYAIFGDNLLKVFTSDELVLARAPEFMWWMILFPLLSFVSYLWDGIFIGLTASRAMRDSMTISLAIYLLSYYFSRSFFGPHALWFSLLVLMIARGGIQWWMYYKRGTQLS